MRVATKYSFFALALLPPCMFPSILIISTNSGGPKNLAYLKKPLSLAIDYGKHPGNPVLATYLINVSPAGCNTVNVYASRNPWRPFHILMTSMMP